MKKTNTILAGAFLLAAAMPALSETYECKLRMSKSGGNWMGPTIYVDYDRKNGSATVIDGVINEFLGKPLAVSKITENDKRITFGYDTRKFPGTSTGRNGTVFANQVYRLTILKPGLKARIFMKPVGYRNTWRDSGQCIVKK